MKLLIVDDDIYTREGLAETIPWNLYGIDDVMQAENGKEALHTVSWYLPDLIITDIRMPQKNGIDFCREAIRLVPDCKIIFITGYMQTEYLKDAIDLSAVAFIEKPIQPEAVMEALGTHPAEKGKRSISEESFFAGNAAKGSYRGAAGRTLQKLWIFLHPSGTVSMYSDLGAGFRNG